MYGDECGDKDGDDEERRGPRQPGIEQRELRDGKDRDQAADARADEPRSLCLGQLARQLGAQRRAPTKPTGEERKANSGGVGAGGCGAQVEGGDREADDEQRHPRVEGRAARQLNDRIVSALDLFCVCVGEASGDSSEYEGCGGVILEPDGIAVERSGQQVENQRQRAKGSEERLRGKGEACHIE